MIFFSKTKERNGQSLLELLLAIVLGIILIGAMVVVIAPTLRINTETNESKIGASLGRELVEDLRVFADQNWHNIDTLATGTLDTNNFYITSTNSIFVTSTGRENITIGTTTYTRYFFLEDICRDSNKNNNVSTTSPPCAGSLTSDPSTKKATVVFRWPQGATSTFSTLFTRWKSKIFWQTDWSKGVTSTIASATSSAMGFVSSSNISYASTSGAIYITSVFSD